MGFKNNLIALLEPMRLYDLTEGDGYAELSAIGKALDSAKEYVANALAQCVCMTADDEGLTSLETLFPIAVKGATVSTRRQMLRRLFAVNDAFNTLDDLEETFAALGLPCMLIEKDDMTVDIILSSHRGEATDLEKEIANIVMPAHVGFECTGQCVTWNRLQTLYNTFNALENSGKTFAEIMELT